MTSLNKFSPTADELDFARASMPIVEPKKPIAKSKYSATPEELEFASASMAEPMKEEIPWYKSYPAAAIKGLTKGIISLGESFGGLHQPRGMKEEQEQQRAELLEKALPSEEGFVEGALERGGKILPSALAGPGGITSALVRTGAAALSGETAKKLGAGETGQAIAELPAFLAPGLGKKIIPTKKQAEVVSEARRLGMTEKEIAPLIQSEKKQAALSKYAFKGDNTKEILQGSKKAVGNIYNALSESEVAKKTITPEIYQEMTEGFKKSFEKIPSEMLKKIAPDIKIMIEGDITGEKMMNFYHKLNHYINKGDAQLGLLMNPLKKSIESVSTELAKDFKMANKLYERSAKIRKSLNPKSEEWFSKLMRGSAPYRMAAGILSGYYPILLEAIGEQATRQLATKMLTSPRFQNLTKQMIDAAANNQFKLAMNVKDILKNEIEDDVPEAAALLDHLEFNPQ